MADEIPPALTPDEWATGNVDRREPGRGDMRARMTSGLELFVGWEESGDDAWQVFIPPAGLHALAALALHGQPFGFTRADVEMLRGIAESDYTGEHGMVGPGAAVLRLAAKLAALLPPE